MGAFGSNAFPFIWPWQACFRGQKYRSQILSPLALLIRATVFILSHVIPLLGLHCPSFHDCRCIGRDTRSLFPPCAQGQSQSLQWREGRDASYCSSLVVLHVFLLSGLQYCQQWRDQVALSLSVKVRLYFTLSFVWHVSPFVSSVLHRGNKLTCLWTSCASSHHLCWQEEDRTCLDDQKSGLQISHLLI